MGDSRHLHAVAPRGGGDGGRRRRGRGERTRVLLVDHDHDHRARLRDTLTRAGRFDVVAEASDGSQAVRAAGRQRPEVVLLDRPDGADEASLPHLTSVAPETMVAVLAVEPADPERDRLEALGAFACYDLTRLDVLPDLVAADLTRFRSASGPPEPHRRG